MTETLDKLYLEWSNFTTAKTARDLRNEATIADLLEALKEATKFANMANNYLAGQDLPASVGWMNAIAKAKGSNHV